MSLVKGIEFSLLKKTNEINSYKFNKLDQKLRLNL